MSLWTSAVEVFKPHAFQARLKDINEEHERILHTLQLLEKPAISDVTAATDKAAEFH
jgi:hypothetical protein